MVSSHVSSALHSYSHLANVYSNRNEPFRSSANYPKVHWEAPQSDLEQADSDVLILLDTCGSANTPPSSTVRSYQRQATTELLGSFEHEDFDLRSPTMTFTSILIDQLKKFHDGFEMFSVAELHRDMVTQWNKEVMAQREVVKSVVPFYTRVNGKIGAGSLLVLPIELPGPKVGGEDAEALAEMF